MPIRVHGCFSIIHECSIPPLSFRLFDIVHADQKLYLVFEFLDVDLKRYMENANKSGRPITSAITKVGPRLSHAPSTHPASCALSARIYAYMTRARTVRRVATRPLREECIYHPCHVIASLDPDEVT